MKELVPHFKSFWRDKTFVTINLQKKKTIYNKKQRIELDIGTEGEKE